MVQRRVAAEVGGWPDLEIWIPVTEACNMLAVGKLHVPTSASPRVGVDLVRLKLIPVATPPVI